MIPENVKEAVLAEARTDAKLFVDEFSEPLDPARTDWDGEAWANSSAKLTAREAGCEDEAWQLYQKTLVSETQKLSTMYYATYGLPHENASEADANAVYAANDAPQLVTLEQVQETCRNLTVRAKLTDEAGFTKGWVKSDGTYTLTGLGPSHTSMAKFTVWTLDVWGHGHDEDGLNKEFDCDGSCDGYTVNDRFKRGRVELNPDPDSSEVLRVLLAEGLLDGKPEQFEVDSTDGEFWEVSRASDGYPLLQLVSDPEP